MIGPIESAIFSPPLLTEITYLIACHLTLQTKGRRNGSSSHLNVPRHPWPIILLFHVKFRYLGIGRRRHCSIEPGEGYTISMCEANLSYILIALFDSNHIHSATIKQIIKQSLQKINVSVRISYKIYRFKTYWVSGKVWHMHTTVYIASSIMWLC